MKIALVVYGSRGDVQPMSALATGLKQKGHEVIFCASPDHEEFVKKYQVPFADSGKNQKEVFKNANIRADRNDLSYVMVEITDAEGKVIPNADDIPVDFRLEGNGEIAGVGSGSPTDMSSFQQPRKKTWHGRCLAIVRSSGEGPGTITLTTGAEGLEGASVEIVTK
jgi:hypothetical protein